MSIDLLVVVVIVTALVFDFTNGFHDTANAMATSIATGALKPRVAVTVSAVLNLVGAFISVQVARTISGGIVDETKITPAVVFGGLVGAIIWNLITWYLGLPSSSSHALIGGLIGATWVAAGGNAVHFGEILVKVVVPALISPLLAGVAAAALTAMTYRLTRRAEGARARTGFRAAQVLSSCALSLAHGTNDAQKTMGVITLVLITAGMLPNGAGPPLWVIACCGVAIAVGTYAGGWRIIRTLGQKITDMAPRQGFAAESASTAVILVSSHFGLSLSTTQVISGGITGTALGRRSSTTRWSTVGRMAIAWTLTLPAAALVGALAGTAADTGAVGVICVAVAAALAGTGLFLASRRDVVNARNVVTAAPATVEQNLPAPRVTVQVTNP